MAFHQLIKTQKIPASIEEVWDFVSSPMNLKDITPDYMGFKVTNGTGEGKMYPGMIMTYKVSPLFGLKIDWMTEITHVKDHEFFVDEQRSGPYKIWHHEHHLEKIQGGILMRDIVTYVPPFGILGTIANSIFIKNQLKSIFEYRFVAIEKKFGTFK